MHKNRSEILMACVIAFFSRAKIGPFVRASKLHFSRGLKCGYFGAAAVAEKKVNQDFVRKSQSPLKKVFLLLIVKKKVSREQITVYITT